MKQKTTGERIQAIRGEMSQAEFGKLLDASQGAVSAWERDDPDRSPSAAIYFRLAALAIEVDDTIFFLEQAGLDQSAVLSVANMLMKKGEVKMDAILATAEGRLNERLGDQKQMADEGKVILVPPFPEGPSAAQSPVLAAPALLIPNKASIYYVLGQSDPLDVTIRGFAPGDYIFFDSSETGTGEILERLVGEELLVCLTRGGGSLGLFVCRPGFVTNHTSIGPKFYIALFPPDVPPFVWSHDDHLSFVVAKVGGSWGASHFEQRRRHRTGDPHLVLPPDWCEFSECRVLGKVVARFHAGTVEIWKRHAQGQ